MTKSLLTRQDIRIFISDAISSIKPNEPYLYTISELCRKINLSDTTIKKYIRLGLPVHSTKNKKRYFMLYDVINWFNLNNLEIHLT